MLTNPFSVIFRLTLLYSEIEKSGTNRPELNKKLKHYTTLHAQGVLGGLGIALTPKIKRTNTLISGPT